jgi:peptide/nickel transport system substrate-binding protein
MRRILAGCALLTIAAVPAGAQTVTVAFNQDIRSSDPGVNRDGNTDTVILHVVEGLFGYGADGEIGPLLAKTVQISPDGKTYEFTLRQGVKFHNGSEMTSADVLWSWNRDMDPRTGWRCKAAFDGHDGTKVIAATAPAPDTFVMTLAEPDASFLATLALPDCGGTAVISPASVKPDGTWDKPIGTGPFKFGEWKRGQSVTLTAFADYVSPPGESWNGYLGLKKPLVQAVRFLAVPDGATVTAGLRSGEIDVASVPESQVAELRQDPNLAVEIVTDPVRHGFILQTRNPLLGNVKLRQAIAAAIDDKALVDDVSDGLGQVNNSPIYQTSHYYGPVEKQGFTYDPDRARRLLQEAGYKGEPIVLIANQRGNMPSYPSAVIAQQMWQAVGLNVRINILDWATQLDRYNTGNYMMAAMSFSPRFDPALGFEQIVGPKDTQPRKVWENPRAVALTAKAMQTTDPAARQALFDTLHRLLLDDVPLIFTHNGISALAHNKHIAGVRPWAAPTFWGVSNTSGPMH